MSKSENRRTFRMKDADVIRLTEDVLNELEGQNWSDEPMTERERDLIGMAVVAALTIGTRLKLV